MKFIFFIYFGFNVFIYMFVIVSMVILNKIGVDLNLIFNKSPKNKTLQEWVFPYFIFFFLNLFMYLMVFYL